MMKLWLIVICLINTATGETIFRCIQDSTDRRTVFLTCPPGRVIKPVEAVYGRNQWQQCIYTVGDCTEKVDLDPECCGRRKCNITLWRYSVQCGYLTFFRVIYECIEAEDSECRRLEQDEEIDIEEEEDVVTSLKFPFTPPGGSQTHKTHVLTDQGSPKNQLSDPAMPTKQNTKSANEDAGYLAVIIGSAVAVAFLLAAIIVVIFLLRRYKWNGEKECIMQLFVGLCKRHPPDGCENPEEEERACSSNLRHQGNSKDCTGTRYNMNDKQISMGKHLDISKNMPTKRCNIDAQNLQNETKLENNNHSNENNGQHASHRQSPSGNTDLDVAHNGGLNKDERDAENNYVEFDKIIGERYSNPVLRNMNPKRIVLDNDTKADVACAISEEPGTTAV